MKRTSKKAKMAGMLVLFALAGTYCMSCGDSPAQGDKEPGEAGNKSIQTAEETVADTHELTELEKRQALSDNLEDEDFGGKAFRIIVGDEYEFVEEFYVDSLTGDTCNDAVYNRNAKIESRFHCKISVLPQATRDEAVNTLKKIVQSGADDAELGAYVDYMACKPVGAGSCMNWLEVPNVDVTQPWHNKLANDGATINGKLYSICSDLSLSSMTYTYAMFFNTRLAANYDMEAATLYNYVREGKWTIDQFIACTKDLYADLNGDGKKDENDLYGFGYNIVNPADVWLPAFDQPLTQVTDDGRLEITFMCDKTDAALSKMRSYQEDSEGFYKYAVQYDEEKFFANGTLVFAPLRFNAAYKALRDMKDTYSILPYPKWDEAQEQYFTNADDKFQVFSVPQTVSDPAYVGKIFEALCAESYKNVYPVYYDVALKGKYSSDENTAEMIDLIMTGRKFDVSFQFGVEHFARLPYLFRDMLVSPSVSLTSKYASVEKMMNKRMEKFYGIFEDVE